MKVFFVFLISVLSTTIFAQNLEFSVIVKNVETGLVIDEVNITALKTKQAFLTNINGEANINLKSESDLKFENISYKPYVVKFADLDKKVNEIYL